MHSLITVIVIGGIWVTCHFVGRFLLLFEMVCSYNIGHVCYVSYFEEYFKITFVISVRKCSRIRSTWVLNL